MGSPAVTAQVRPDEKARDGAGRRRARTVWWAAFILLSLLGGAWSVASPLFSVPDEPAHATYAAGVVRGQVFTEASSITSRVVEVPAEYADAGVVIQCFAFQPTVSAGCAPAFGVPGDELERVPTAAGRYPPAYYAVAGLPTLVLGDAEAAYAMRWATVLMTAVLLASAVASAFDRSRSPWPVLGVVAAVTPMVLFFAGGVNPQAPEIAAGVLLWSAGLALLGRWDPTRSISGPPCAPAAWTERRLILRVCVAAGSLAVVRPIAPLWLALIVVLLLLAAADLRTLALLRRPLLLAGIAVVAVLGVSTVVWVVAADALIQQQVGIYADLDLDRAVLVSVFDLNDDLLQMIGVFGWLDTNPPAFVHYGWLVLLGTLAVLAVAFAGRRGVLVLTLLVLTGMVVPVLLEVSAYRESAFAWQGRYILPLLVGFPILAGHLLDGREVVRRPRRVVAALLVVAIVCHVGAFVGILNRNLRGTDAFWYLDPPVWVPPFPTWSMVSGYVVTLVVAVVLILRSAPGVDTEPDKVEEPARAGEEVPDEARHR